MTKLEQDIEQIKKSIEAIENCLGIGKIRPAKVIDLRIKAKEKAASIRLLKHGS